jgi:hypothetical protein
MDVEKNHSVKNHRVQMDLTKDFPEVFPLLKRPITAYLQAWSYRLSEFNEGGLWHLCGADKESTLSPSTLPPYLMDETMEADKSV